MVLPVFFCFFGFFLAAAGLFVIQGVSTCGNGRGYCLLSDRCGVDVDFEDDVDGGHCDGLSRHGFTPAVYFLCCRFRQPSSLDTVPPEVRFFSGRRLPNFFFTGL